MTQDPPARQRFAAAALLAVVAGLALAGAGAGDWVVHHTQREVAGLAVTQVAATAGTRLAPAALPLGLAIAAAGGLLAVGRGRLRRATGLAVLACGLGGLVVVGAGVARAASLPGRLTGAALWAGLAAALAAAAGALALRGPPAPAPPRARYALDRDEADADREWTLASQEGEDEPGAGRSLRGRRLRRARAGTLGEEHP
ncbi:MAG TPA: hypothetical protein VG452_02635 [Egibacteraceae bacterium]|nr:hypothetical protein [Egibacteraceae bacterium]